MKAIMKPYELCVTPVTKTSFREITVLSPDLGKGWKKKWQQGDSRSRWVYPQWPERGEGKPPTPTLAPLRHDAVAQLPKHKNLQKHRWKTEIKDSVRATATLL